MSESTSNPLARWLAREARRQARTPDVLSALLLQNGFAYARYRLGFVATRIALRTSLHALELYLLAQVLPFEYFAPLLSYRAIAALAGTWHWGALEGLRLRVRECTRTHRARDARDAVSGWLGASSLLACVPVIVFALRMLHGELGKDGGVSLYDAYGFACFARLACEVFARTYHAGVFALRRVYRPLPSLLVADLLELLLIVTCFERLGAWSLPCALLGAGLADTGIALHYARRAYRLARLLLPQLSACWKRSLWRRLSWLHAREAALQGVANLSMQLDGLFFLLLLRVAPPRAGFSLSLIYYVLRPVLGFGSQWVRSFYFDLSRFAGGSHGVLSARLARYLQLLALACGFAVSIVVVLAALIFWPTRALWPVLNFVPFAFARGLFANAQLQAFAAGRQRALIAVATTLVVGLSCLAWLWPKDIVLMSGASVFLLVSYVCLMRTQTAFGRQSTQLGLAAWLSSLRIAGNVRVASLQVMPGAARAARVASALQKFPGLLATRVSRSHLLIFAPADVELSVSALVTHCGGVLCHVWLSPACLGVDSLALARLSAGLPDELQRALAPSAQVLSAQTLCARFRQEFPEGTLIDLEAGSGSLARCGLPRALIGEFMRALSAASRQRESSHDLPVQLAVYAPRGEPQLVFVVPRAQRMFLEFRIKAREASLHASVYPPANAARPLGWLGSLRAFGERVRSFHA
jgi:hypothetical protein